MAFNIWIGILFAGGTGGVPIKDSIAEDTSYSIMYGVFTIGENAEVPQSGKIIVKNSETKVLVGVCKPNKKNG